MPDGQLRRSVFPLHWAQGLRPSEANGVCCAICNSDWSETLPKRQPLGPQDRVALTVAPEELFREVFTDPADRAYRDLLRLMETVSDKYASAAAPQFFAAFDEAATIFIRRSMAERIGPFFAETANIAVADTIGFMAIDFEGDTRIQELLGRPDARWSSAHGGRDFETFVRSTTPTAVEAEVRRLVKSSLSDAICRQLAITYTAARAEVLKTLG